MADIQPEVLRFVKLLLNAEVLHTPPSDRTAELVLACDVATAVADAYPHSASTDALCKVTRDEAWGIISGFMTEVVQRQFSNIKFQAFGGVRADLYKFHVLEESIDFPHDLRRMEEWIRSSARTIERLSSLIAQ